jgi:hypothetical protein
MNSEAIDGEMNLDPGRPPPFLDRTSRFAISIRINEEVRGRHLALASNREGKHEALGNGLTAQRYRLIRLGEIGSNVAAGPGKGDLRANGRNRRLRHENA